MSRFYKIDDIDLKILELLAENGKMSNVELSKQIGVSPSPCLRRVKILESQGIISSYSAEVNVKALGYELLFFASINIEVKNEVEQSTFEKGLDQIKEITEIYLLNSGKDYLVKMLVKNYLDYKMTVNDKLSRLPFIKNIRTIKVASVIKKMNFVKQDS